MREFDFGASEVLFVSTSVQAWQPCLGDVVDGVMWLNEYGNIVAEHWRRLEQRFAILVLHTFVVLPDQIQAILEIDRTWEAPEKKVVSLNGLVDTFKASSRLEIQATGLPDFEWQHAFLEFRIRDELTYESISRNVASKPSSWVSETTYEIMENKAPPTFKRSGSYVPIPSPQS